MSISSFINGMRDCRDGVPYKPKQDRDYNRGYAVQYELEQIQAHQPRKIKLSEIREQYK